jgi:single-strand DNA-binding protein
MASLNRVQLIGNLGRDPEMRYMPDGTPTATISLATSETWKDKQTGEKKESTEWHRVVFYRGLAEVVGEYLTQGSAIYVEGKLKTRKYADKDGSDKYVTEIRASELLMLGGKRKKDGEAGGEGQRYSDPDADDIPF